MLPVSRLTKRHQFEEVRRNGQVYWHRLLTLRLVRNNVGTTRYGLTVGRRVGNAVVRNRIRRRIREIVRKVPVFSGWDVVFMVRVNAVNAEQGYLCEAVYDVLKRAHITISSTSSQVSKECEKR